MLPKIIFCYWEGKSLNDPIVAACLNSWKRHLTNWQVYFINDTNIVDFVDMNFLTTFKGKVSVTSFSDFLRLYLLKKFGGVWMDISTIVLDEGFLNQYYDETIHNAFEATVYKFERKLIDFQLYYLESWFLMAKKECRFIADVYAGMIKAHEIGFLNYRNFVLSPIKNKLQGILDFHTEDTYLMMHAIVIYLLHQGNHYALNIKDSAKSMLRIHHEMNWNDHKIAKRLQEPLHKSDFYAIKLTGWDRNQIKLHGLTSFLHNIQSV